MSKHLPIPEREAQAKREIGVTDISRRSALFLLFGLVLLLLVGIVPQLFTDPAPLADFADIPRAAREGWQRADPDENRLFAANRAALRAMDDWETDLEDTAWFHGHIRDAAQPLLWRLGSGDGQAVRGRDGWLQFQPDLDYLTGPGFDIDPVVSTIVDLRDQLAERGIRLLVVPAPAKAQIHPESIARRHPSLPLRNPSETQWLKALAEEDVAVLDLAQILAGHRNNDQKLYLKTDTHWTPEGMRIAAEETAGLLFEREWVQAAPGNAVTWEEREITHHGDITVMLSLPEGQTLIPPETIRHQRPVLESDAPARVLLLGDSFSNIFSLEGMGWGDGGGFAEHIAAALRQPVNAIVRNDAGASATREMLANDLMRGRDRLEGVDVVVWQFAARELAFGDWRKIHMPVPAREPAPMPGEVTDAAGPLTVTATVAEISDIPRPAQVTYADHVATVHLRDVTSDDGGVQNARVVARVLSMENRELREPARWRPGTRLRLKLVPFQEVESRYGALNTSVLDDIDLLLAEPFWVEEVLP